MAPEKKIDLPDGLFDLDDVPTTPSERVPTPLEKFLGRKRMPNGELVPKKKPKRTIAASAFDRTMLDTMRMVETGHWQDAGARHIVALYAIMHRKVYKVDPSMSGTERYTLTMLAGGFVKRAFASDIDRAIDYLRWVWTREIGREKWRRENQREGARISFRAMISNAVLDDYRVAMARKR